MSSPTWIVFPFTAGNDHRLRIAHIEQFGEKKVDATVVLGKPPWCRLEQSHFGRSYQQTLHEIYTEDDVGTALSAYIRPDESLSGV